MGTKLDIMRSTSLVLAVAVAAVACLGLVAARQPSDLGYQAISPSSGEPTYTIVETIPSGLNITTPATIFDGWMDLISNAEYTLDLAYFYTTLTNGSSYIEYGGARGNDVYDALIAAHQRGVRIRFVQSEPEPPAFYDADTAALADAGVIELRSINFTALIGSGILHTKMMIADSQHMYVGSANCDWRSLAQVKELGVILHNSPELVKDTWKVFEEYWLAANETELPHFDSYLDASYNYTNPLVKDYNDTQMEMYVAVSPPQFATPNRDTTRAAILQAIGAAKEFVYISVMDYLPVTLYEKTNFYSGEVDEALRAAAFNHDIEVKLMAGYWEHTSSEMLPYLKSLNALSNVEVNVFIVPPLANVTIPFTRVNHPKYMVTDLEAHITTNNWTPDYFIDTGGVAVVLRGGNAVEEVKSRFERDWYSSYAVNVDSL